MKSGKNAKYEKAYFNTGLGNDNNSKKLKKHNYNTGLVIFSKNVSNEAVKKANKLAKNVCRQSKKK